MSAIFPMHLQTGTQALDDSNWRRYTLLDADAKSRAPRLFALETIHNAKPAEFDTRELPVVASWPLVPRAELAEVCAEQTGAARQAVAEYRRFTLEQRLELVHAVGARILAKLDSWRELTVQEGYTYSTFTSCVEGIAQVFDDDYMRVIAERLRPSKKAPHTTLEHVPFGVVGVVVPSNAAFPMLTQVIHGALLSGNAVIAKPSHRLALVGLRLVEEIALVLEEHGAPSALVSSITTRANDELTNCWLAPGGIDQVVYIGSSTHRDPLIAQCREVGVKQPLLEREDIAVAYVHDDLDGQQLARVAKQIAYAKNVASGQCCISLERLYVAAGISERLMAKLVEEFGRYHPGSLREDDPFIMGPSAKALQLRALLADFCAEGGRVICGGRRLDAQGAPSVHGVYVEPTLVECADPESPLLREEILMPVLPVVEVHGGVEEAARLISLTEFGIRASVYTTNSEVIDAFQARVEVGTVLINSKHLDSSIQLAGGRGGNTLDQHARSWALDLNLRRVRIEDAPTVDSTNILARAVCPPRSLESGGEDARNVVSGAEW